MDDLDQFIQAKENSTPTFSQLVDQRTAELEIAYRLRQARESLRLTRQQIAARSSISLRMISQIENACDDRISLHAIKQYAHALGLTLKMDLMSETSDSRT